MTFSDPSSLAHPGAFAAQLAWPEVQARLEADFAALLPIGAAAKEHGRHLPLHTDFLQAEWLALALARIARVLVWPTVGYGYYPAFVEYPGSCSLARDTFVHLIDEIIGCIVDSGARSVIILNTGISTIAPLEDAVGRRPHAARIRLAHVYRGRSYLQAAASLTQQPRGGHADECETSVMLAIAPNLVNMNRAQPWTSASMGPGRLIRSNLKHPNYSPDGVYGDPTLATTEKGETLLKAMIQDIVELIE